MSGSSGQGPYQYRDGRGGPASPVRGISGATRRAYCDAGIATRRKSYAGDHLLGDPRAIDDVVAWLGDRFAGRRMSVNR
ncbi:hypothetical protein HLK59_04130 [Streptomyces sp. S3(2020)]|uniref:hypothetical protein n=1 Tax=Streptomyces sp. S3(2020) TaxID=2732044 RepID=UPI0014881D71|nr:hypothetical protein [Streptomyces sp. S3(2020)]NNN29556.1 hypothetical protein [Streptomyces sp. S3(2020)]